MGYGGKGYNEPTGAVSHHFRDIKKMILSLNRMLRYFKEEEMLTLEELKKELEPYRNTLVLDFCEIVRLVDVIEEPEDFYWKYERWSKGKANLSSCVMGWIPLKGNLPDEIYKSLVRNWNMNHVNQAT